MPEMDVGNKDENLDRNRLMPPARPILAKRRLIPNTTQKN